MIGTGNRTKVLPITKRALYRLLYLIGYQIKLVRQSPLVEGGGSASHILRIYGKKSGDVVSPTLDFYL